MASYETRILTPSVAEPNLFDHLPQQIALLDADGVIVAVNHAWRQVATGNGSENLCEGANYIDACARAAANDQAAARVLSELRAIMDGTTHSCSCEYPCGTADRKRWFLMHASRALGSNLIVVSHFEISAEAMARAHRDELRLRIALEAAYLISFEWDIERDEVRRFFSEDPALRPTGEKVERFQDVCRLVHPEDRNRFIADIDRAVKRHDGRYASEYRILRPNGEHGWVSESGYVEFEAGRPARLIGLSRDITARKAIERDLQESEALSRTIFENSPDCVKLIGADDRVLMISPRGVHLLELDDESEIVGDDFVGFWPPEGREMVRRGLSEARAGTTTQFTAFRPTATGEPKWWECLVAPMQRESACAGQLLIVSRDVTERRRVEQALKDADRRKDELLAVMAHELRNPLAPLRAGLDVLRRSEREDVVAKRVHEMMDRQVAHLIRLVDDLLDVARINGGRIELRKADCDLTAILEHALETSLPAIAAAGHQIVFQSPGRPMPIVADPVRLVQVFSNLINNAAKYTPPGGAISIAVAEEPHGVLVKVRDNGIGISSEMILKVFDLFTQENEWAGQGGLGVGLALARKLVELHGGTVTASSDGKGNGSEFVVRLPQDEVKRSMQDDEGAQFRVLVIDDDRDVADSLKMLLGLLGCNATVAYSGSEALALLAEFKPSLIFLDLGMPDMNGYEAARLIRADPVGRGVELVALTGWGQDADKARSREAGFNRHLVKPADIDALQAVLNSAMK